MVIDDSELSRALSKASSIADEYFRLRALAVISLLRLSGKRRTEISWIPLENFKVENGLLNVTFALEKKKRRHKKCPGCETKNHVKAAYRIRVWAWIFLGLGFFTSKQATSVKAFYLDDPLTVNILSYLDYLRSLKCVSKF